MCSSEFTHGASNEVDAGQILIDLVLTVTVFNFPLESKFCLNNHIWHEDNLYGNTIIPAEGNGHVQRP